MKRLTGWLLGGVAVAAALSSCTMEKRVYMPGYHVEWKGTQGATAPEHDQGGEVARSEEEERNGFFGEGEWQHPAREGVETSDAGVDIAVVSTQLEQDGENGRGGDEWLGDLDDEVQRSENNIHSPTPNEVQEEITWASEWREGTGAILAEAQDVRVNGMAVAGFVLGLVGLLIFGLLFGLLAIIFSAIGLGKINKDPSRWRGKGLAVAGLVIGIIDILVLALLVAMLV
jgi:hypothetical protein